MNSQQERYALVPRLPGSGWRDHQRPGAHGPELLHGDVHSGGRLPIDERLVRMKELRIKGERRLIIGHNHGFCAT